MHEFSSCLFFFFFNLTYSRWASSLPSCLWSQRIFPSLPGSRLPIFLSRCKFSTLTTRQPMVEFYLLTFPRFPLRKKEHKSYFGKNRTHDFRTSRCAAYLLDHSGDESATCNLVYVLIPRVSHSESKSAGTSRDEKLTKIPFIHPTLAWSLPRETLLPSRIYWELNNSITIWRQR